MLIARALPMADVALASIFGGAQLEAQDGDVEAVKRIALAESEAYFRRDSIAFKRAWVQDSSAVIMYVGSGNASVNLGWEKFGPGIMQEMKTSPTPVAIKLAPSNHRVYIDGALAFVEYDETASFPPDSTIYRNRQHRALLKRDGEWRIFSSGIYDMSSFDVTPLAIERRLRAMGVALSGVKKHRDAIEILKLNAQLFPNSPRVYQALGEAYATSGDSKLAIGNYEKSLAIDPNNATSKSAFAKLRGGKAP